MGEVNQQDLFPAADPYAIQPGWDGRIFQDDHTYLCYCTPCKDRFLVQRNNNAFKEYEEDVIFQERCVGCGRDFL